MILSLLVLAAISGDALISALIWLVVVALIYFVVTWGLAQFKLPEPFNTVIRVIVVLVVVFVVINVLLTLAGHPLIRW